MLIGLIFSNTSESLSWYDAQRREVYWMWLSLEIKAPLRDETSTKPGGVRHQRPLSVLLDISNTREPLLSDNMKDTASQKVGKLGIMSTRWSFRLHTMSN